MAKSSLVTGVHTPLNQGKYRKSLNYGRGPEDILIRKENSFCPEKIYLPLCKKHSLPDGLQCTFREESSSGIFFCRGKENCPL